MSLDPAVFLELAAACAPSVAPATMLAIARVESGLDPLAIGVNGGGRRPARARTSAQAVGAAEALIRAGRDIDLGIAQINVRNLAWLGLSLPDAFDPCRNLAAGAKVLSEGYRRAAGQGLDERRRLWTALSYYNTGHPTRGLRNGYVARVAAAARAAPSASPGPVPDTGPAPRAWDVFARARRAPATSSASSSAGDRP